LTYGLSIMLGLTMTHGGDYRCGPFNFLRQKRSRRKIAAPLGLCIISPLLVNFKQRLGSQARVRGTSMVQKTATKNNGTVDSLIPECAATLQRVANYRMPAAMDRRLLWLSENKESLTPPEREELLALVDFSEDRTVEKLDAKVLVQRLAEAWPQLVVATP
jgi:hypothetical protein